MHEFTSVKKVLFVMISIAIFGIYMIFFKVDNVFPLVVGDIDKQRVYPAVKLSNGRKIKENIRFLDFYSCLSEYKSLYEGKVPKGHENSEYYVEVKVSKDRFLLFTIKNNKAYKVSARIVDEYGQNKQTSNAYSIMCDINLLEVMQR